MALLLTGAVFALIGALFIYLAARSRKQATASQEWPNVPGRVLRSEIQEHTNSEDNTTYSPMVEYEYAVSGASYRSKRVSFGGVAGGIAAAQEVVQRYPANAAVQVYYDPAKHSSAVLERKATSSKLLTILGGIFVLVGVVLAIVGLVSKG